MIMNISIQMIRYCLLILLLCAFSACDSKTDKMQSAQSDKSTVQQTKVNPLPAALVAKTLLMEPLDAHLIESPEMALPIFRETMEQKPVLVLMANNPLLAPFPPSEQQKISTLLTGPRDMLAKAVTPFQTTPALLPNMTVTAALTGDYFSRVLWVIPTTADNDTLSAAQIKRQLLELGAIDETEAVSFQDNATGIVAMIRNVPWQIVRYTEIPKLENSTVLYLDMDFFQPIYKGEIKTPLLEIFHTLLNNLKEKDWNTFNLVICRNNLNGLPLETRFFADDLATAFRNPKILDGEPLIKWQQRKNALYLDNFMQNDKIHEIYREMLKNDPEDPSIKFALYQVLRRLKRVDEALDFLNQAVATDRYYGLEYLNLAEVAAKKNLVLKQVEMFDRASNTFPDNPFLELEKVRLMVSMGHSEQAEKLVEELLKIQWSPLYFKDMEKYLNNLLAKSSNNKDMK